MVNFILQTGQSPPVGSAQGKPAHNCSEAVSDGGSFKEALKTEKKKVKDEVDESLAGVAQVVCVLPQPTITVEPCESVDGSATASEATVNVTDPTGFCGQVLSDVDTRFESTPNARLLSDMESGTQETGVPTEVSEPSAIEQALTQMVAMSEISSSVNPESVVSDSQPGISPAANSSEVNPENPVQTVDGKVENPAQTPVKNDGEQAVSPEFGKVFLDTGKVLETESTQAPSPKDTVSNISTTNIKPVEVSQDERLPITTPEVVKHSGLATSKNKESTSGEGKVRGSDNQFVASTISAAGEASAVAGRVTETSDHRLQMTTQNLQEITRAIELSQQTGKTFVRIRLNPQELGMIDIRLSSSSSGVGVSILTEHSSTGRLLESQMEQLRQTLNDAGIQLNNMDIGPRGQGQQEHGKSMGSHYQSSNKDATRSNLQKHEIDLRNRREGSSYDLATASRLIDYRA